MGFTSAINIWYHPVYSKWFINRIKLKQVVKQVVKNNNRLSHSFRTFKSKVLATDEIITDQLEVEGGAVIFS